MIHSMTGYGHAECSNADHSVHLEIRGYNHRYLDIKLSFPETLASFEEEFRALVRRYCVRGRLEASLSVRHINGSIGLSFDPKKAKVLKETLISLKKDLNLTDNITISHLLDFKDYIVLEESIDPGSLAPLLRETSEAGLENFVKSRSREGEETVRDILGQLERFQSGLEQIRVQADDIEHTISKRLYSRFEQVFGDTVKEERVLTEIAALIVKHSINEELSRLQTHIGQFGREIEQKGAAGKRLDFVCQEMNREVNTIASKNIMDEIPTQIIEMKDALENIREQLRNIE